MAQVGAQEFANVRRAPWHARGVFATQTAYVAAATIAVAVVMWFASPNFVEPRNIANIAQNFSFIAIATLGVTLVIITGGIDLSVGSVMAFSAIICSLTMNELSSGQLSPWFMHMVGGKAVANVPGLIALVSVLAGLLVAALIGFLNGFAIAKLGLSPFVTTLGMLSIVRGLAYVVTNGRGSFPAGPDADLFYAVTSGSVGACLRLHLSRHLRPRHGARAAPYGLRAACAGDRRQREGGRAHRHPGVRALRQLVRASAPDVEDVVADERVGAGHRRTRIPWIRVLTSRLAVAGCAGILTDGSLSNVPVTVTAALATGGDDELPHPVSASGASSSGASRTAMRRMTTLGLG